MYRDDPLDDEMELRAVIGDSAVDELSSGPVTDGRTTVEAALDVLRLLQGWADDDEIASWFVTAQRRLADTTPVGALQAGAFDDVEDAARAWAAAHG